MDALGGLVQALQREGRPIPSPSHACMRTLLTCASGAEAVLCGLRPRRQRAKSRQRRHPERHAAPRQAGSGSGSGRLQRRQPLHLGLECLALGDAGRGLPGTARVLPSAEPRPRRLLQCQWQCQCQCQCRLPQRRWHGVLLQRRDPCLGDGEARLHSPRCGTSLARLRIWRGGGEGPSLSSAGYCTRAVAGAGLCYFTDCYNYSAPVGLVTKICCRFAYGCTVLNSYNVTQL